MSAVERVAEVLRENVSFFQYYGPEARDVAQALADAGLLRQSPDELLRLLGPDERSQAQQAFDLDHARDVVIEAAKAWRGGCAAIEYTYPTEDDLAATVDALLEIEGGSQ